MTNITLESGYRITLDTSKIGRYAHRNIMTIKIEPPANSGQNWVKDQPFYESTGVNSGNKGSWYPFDGLALLAGNDWFRKEQYLNPAYEENDIRHRMGGVNLPDFIKDLLLEISQTLPKLELKNPQELTDNQVNPFLNTTDSLVIEEARIREREKINEQRLSRENERQFALR